MEVSEVEKKLFRDVVEKYGDKYIEHFLEQYKIYLSMLDKISDRRQKTNEFFLGLNTALLALLGYLNTRDITSNNSFFIPSALAGIVISFFWYRIVRSYRDLNTGKFKIVHAIEQRLPMSLYETEWEVLGAGKNKRLYLPFTHIEIYVPWVFISIYFIIFASLVDWLNIVQLFYKICLLIFIKIS